MIHQLRIYEIFENSKEAFHKRFREHASRIMKSYGFNIVAAWEAKNGGRTEFLYLLAWPDEKTMQHAWEQFRANAEWLQIKRDTNAKYGDLVGEIQEKVLYPVSQDMFVLRAKAQKESPVSSLIAKQGGVFYKRHFFNRKNDDLS